MQESFYVGLDLGSSQCYQSIINADGALSAARSIPTSEQHLRAAFAHLHGDVRVHLEAGELSDSSLICKLPRDFPTNVSSGGSVVWELRAVNRTAKDWLIPNLIQRVSVR